MNRSEILEAAGGWVSDPVAQWTPDRTRSLNDWLGPDIDLVGDAEWGAKIRDLVQLPVKEPLKWANVCIPLPGNHWAIAGIRFRGRDITKPFVDIIATSLLPEVDQLDALTGVLEYFAEFNPLCLRAAFPAPEGITTSIGSTSLYAGSARTDLLIVAGLLSDMRKQPSLPGSGSVELHRIEATRATQLVEDVYEEISRDNPDIYDWATPANVETLAEAADEGTLFSIISGSIEAGVVACLPESGYGMSGFLIHEVCLRAEFRGHGLGAVALQQLAHTLPHTNSADVMWGHIHPDNRASLRNAQATGREVVSGHVWLTPEGFSGMPK